MFSIDTALVRNPQHVDSSAGNTCVSTYCKNINNWKKVKFKKNINNDFIPVEDTLNCSSDYAPCWLEETEAVNTIESEAAD